MKLLYKTIISFVVVSFFPMLIMGQFASMSMETIRDNTTEESYNALVEREHTRLAQIANDSAYSINQYFNSLYGDTASLANYASFIYKNYNEFNSSYIMDLYPDKNHTGLPGYGYFHPVYGAYADFDHRGIGCPYLNASCVNKTFENETYRDWVCEELHKIMLLDPILKAVYEKNKDTLDVAWVVRLGGLSNAYPWYSYEDVLKENPNYDLTDDDLEDYVVELDPSHNPHKEIKWLEPYLDPTRGTWMISCVAPLYNYSTFLGTLGLDILLSTLTKHVLEMKVGLGGYAFLVDTAGRPIAISNEGIADFVWNKTHKDALQEMLKPLEKQVWSENLKEAMETSLCENPNENISKLIENMCAQETGIEEIILSSEKKIVAYAPIESTKWSICIVIPIKEIVSPAKETESSIKNGINSIIDTFAIGTTIVLVASILIGAVLGYYITKPIAYLTKVTKEISLGNLELQVAVKSKDEIGELSENFDRMLNSIKITISELEKGVENTQTQNIPNEHNAQQTEQIK